MMTSSKILLTSSKHRGNSKNAILMTPAKIYDVSNVDFSIKKLYSTLPKQIKMYYGEKCKIFQNMSSRSLKPYQSAKNDDVITQTNSYKIHSTNGKDLKLCRNIL